MIEKLIVGNFLEAAMELPSLPPFNRSTSSAFPSIPYPFSFNSIPLLFLFPHFLLIRNSNSSFVFFAFRKWNSSRSSARNVSSGPSPKGTGPAFRVPTHHRSARPLPPTRPHTTDPVPRRTESGPPRASYPRYRVTGPTCRPTSRQIWTTSWSRRLSCSTGTTTGWCWEASWRRYWSGLEPSHRP